MGSSEEHGGCTQRDARIQALGQAYARAVLAGDEVAAEIAVREAIEADLTSAEIDEEIIAPALWYVGELWERGEISVADEHLATEISIRVLALQREARRLQRTRRATRVLLATPSGEQHVVALRMVSALLLEAGYDTLMLGPDVPAPAIAASAERHGVDVICLSDTVGSGDRILVSVHEIAQRVPGAAFVVGGRGITGRLQASPGIVVCRRVTDAVEAVDALVKRADLN